MPRLKRPRCGSDDSATATRPFSPPLPSMSFERPLLGGATELSRVFAASRSEAAPSRFLGYAASCQFLSPLSTTTACLFADDTDPTAPPAASAPLVEQLRFYVVPSFSRLHTPKNARHRGTASWLRDCVDDVAKRVLHGAQNAYDAQCVAVFAFADSMSLPMTAVMLHRPSDEAPNDGDPSGKGRVHRRRQPLGGGGGSAATDVRTHSCHLVGLCVGRELSEARRAVHHAPLADAAASHGNDDACSSCTNAAVDASRHWAAESSTELSEATLHGSSVCGVELIWVADPLRRCGIATELIHVLRKNLVYGGHAIPSHAVAFSQPSRDGKLLAAAFSGRRDFFTFDA